MAHVISDYTYQMYIKFTYITHVIIIVIFKVTASYVAGITFAP